MHKSTVCSNNNAFILIQCTFLSFEFHFLRRRCSSWLSARCHLRYFNCFKYLPLFNEWVCAKYFHQVFITCLRCLLHMSAYRVFQRSPGILLLDSWHCTRSIRSSQTRNGDAPHWMLHRRKTSAHREYLLKLKILKLFCFSTLQKRTSVGC